MNQCFEISNLHLRKNTTHIAHTHKKNWYFELQIEWMELNLFQITTTSKNQVTFNNVPYFI